MSGELLSWDIYEINTSSTLLVGVSLRGTLRKYAVAAALNLLVENATDKDNCVRFATLVDEDTVAVEGFIKQTIPEATIERVLQGLPNPVLSKLSIVTNEAKY